MEKITLGKLLKSYRKNEFYSQKEIAEKIGISITSYSLIETDKRLPHPKHFRTIAEILGKTTKELKELIGD